MDPQKINVILANLKEQFNSLIQSSAQLIDRNSQIDSGSKCDIPPPAIKFETALEDFLSSCNSLEYHLKTIQECLLQGRASQQNLPISVSSTKPDKLESAPEPIEPGTSVSYNQYLNAIKYQIDAANAIQNLLEDHVNNKNLQ